VQVTLASQIPKEMCQQINLGYHDPNSLCVSDFEGREPDGVLLVPKAGEMLFQLDQPAAWARGEV
jgi:hypothetical protein